MAQTNLPTPTISVVIAAWNAEKFVADAVRSALAQEGVVLEVIVVDDGSTDGTSARVGSLDDSRCTCITLERNIGPSGADWIAVLDADDRFAPGRLERMVRLADEASADVVVDDLMQVSEDGQDLGPFYGQALAGIDGLTLPEFISANMEFFSAKPSFGYMKPLFRKRFLVDAGLSYDPNLRLGEDYHLLADCLAAGAVAQVDHHAGYCYTRRRGSVSHRLRIEHLERLRAADQSFRRRWPLDDAAEDALRRRSRAIDDAIAFAAAVEAIKRGGWIEAGGALLRQPTAALLFRHPIHLRLARLADGWR
jgi:succinoglycan biosynthesis protein ExoO